MNKIYTSELILCFTICVHSATRHNINIKLYAVHSQTLFAKVESPTRYVMYSVAIPDNKPLFL